MNRDDILKTCAVLLIGLLALVGVLLLAPRSGEPLQPGEAAALGAAFDPHLFVTVDREPTSLRDGTSQPVTIRVTAANTAAGDLRIDLGGVRVGLDAGDGTAVPQRVAWAAADGRPLPGGVLGAGQRATARIEVTVDAVRDGRRMTIWRETWLTGKVPLLRRTALTPRLELRLDALTQAGG